jgi:HEAT repeat protein
VRREAVVTLAFLRLPEAFGPLLARVSDPDARVRRLAIGALIAVAGGRGGGVGVGVGAGAGAEGSAEVGADAKREQALVATLTAALADSDWQVRAEAALVLGRGGLESGAPALVAALENQAEAWQVRKEVAQALGKLKVEAAAAGLVALLGAENADLRKVAAGALGELGAGARTAALQPLEALQADVDVEVKKAATRALAAIRAALRVEAESAGQARAEPGPSRGVQPRGVS